MFRKSFCTIVIFMVCTAALTPETGKTIPAFARKYGFSCSTCHVAAPKLKEYGDEFAGNGFQLPDEEEPVRAYRDVGDDMLLLQRDLPLAIRFDAFGQYVTKGSKNTDFQTPYGLKILSGGNVAKDVGYYIYFYMSERGEVAGIEDAYVHFNNIGGSELDLMIGQFQISDPLFKRELRLTYEDYHIYKTKIEKSKANLTYDRGIIATYSLPSKTDLVLEVVNGNGLEEAGADRLFDGDNFKNVFLKVSQGIPYVSLGMFGYIGKEKDSGEENSFSMFGPDAVIGTEMIELSAQYVRRTDDNPGFVSGSVDDVITDGFIGELVLNPFPDTSRLYGVLLYNRVSSDYKTADYETITAHASYLFRTNLRLMGELTYDIENEETAFTLGYMAGF